MASSGVLMDERAVELFGDMKLGKNPLQYITYKIENGKIVVDQERPKAAGAKGDEVAANTAAYEEFCQALPSEDPRYCVFDYHLETPQQASGPRINDVLIFIHWVPESCGIKQKMLYASSKEEIKKKLRGIQAEVQANDFDDLQAKNVEDKIRSSKSL